MTQPLQVLLLFLIVQKTLPVLSGKSKDKNSEKGDSRTVKTEDGCPYDYDNGKFMYKYTKPEICKTLLPKPLAALKPEKSPAPFGILLEPTDDSDDPYYNVILSVLGNSTTFIAGAVLKIQRLKPNGNVTDEPAGHLEGSLSWTSQYCCSNSKYHTLLTYFRNVTANEVRFRKMKLKWYPMNFPPSQLVLTAKIFAEVGTGMKHWKIKSEAYRYPILPPTTPEAPDDGSEDF